MAKWEQAFAYNGDYGWNLRFTSVEVNSEVQPQWVLCLKVFARSSFKEAKLRLHLESKHVKYVDENLEVFKEKEQQVKRNHIDRPSTLAVEACSHSKAVPASFLLLGKLQEQKRLILYSRRELCQTGND